MRKYWAEFLGTFFLFLTISMSSYAKVSADLQPLAIGLMYMAMVYAGGHISGAHFNPAVTFALVLRNKLPLREAAFYWIAQFIAAIGAAFTALFLISGKPIVAPLNTPPQYFAVTQALLAELLGTFILVWVVMQVGFSKVLEGNNFYGLAIGTVTTGLIYSLGAVSGGAFNPAVAVAACFAQLSSWSYIWVYLVGGFGGAALAALAYRYIKGDE